MPPKNLIKNPLIVALDVDTKDQALRLAEDLSEVAGCFKIGPRLLNRYGESLIKELTKFAPVFVDCKFFDIPSTMAAAVRQCFDAGATLVTVHALSGEEALRAVVAEQTKQKHDCLVLAVTILTSWDEKSIPEVIKKDSISNHVQSLAKLAQKSGIEGIVCSASELELITDLENSEKIKLFKVTPGIRFDLEDQGDQKRTMSPGQAIAKGANAIVVGRPIIAAKNPREAAVDYSIAVMEKK
jgi:orotidine-5'-phosphate decarboxylase